MSLMTTTVQVEGGVIYELEGRLDNDTYEQAENELGALLHEGHKVLALDLSRLVFLSSSGLRVFLSLAKKVRLARPHTVVAQERTTLDAAYPGDVVGLINRDVFRIGDTISLGGKPFERVIPAALPTRNDDNKALRLLWARREVQRLMLLGLVAALGAWSPRPTLRLLGVGGAVAAVALIASLLLS